MAGNIHDHNVFKSSINTALCRLHVAACNILRGHLSKGIHNVPPIMVRGIDIRLQHRLELSQLVQEIRLRPGVTFNTMSSPGGAAAMRNFSVLTPIAISSSEFASEALAATVYL